MTLYHETPPQNVESIRDVGFWDSEPVLQESGYLAGVFVSDEPISHRFGDAVLAIETDLSDDDLAPYAYNKRTWRPHGSHYREWCVPAKRLNEYHWHRVK